MFAKLLIHLRQQYAGFLALFIVLGGSSYAVANGSIDSREIKNNSIRSKDVRDRTLTHRDINRSTLGQLRGAQGPQGAQGPGGPQGAQGPRGPAGATNVVVRTANGIGTATASCAAGERATGGGGDAVTGGSFLYQSRPEGSPPTEWRVRGEEVDGTDTSVTAYVLCASP